MGPGYTGMFLEGHSIPALFSVRGLNPGPFSGEKFSGKTAGLISFWSQKLRSYSIRKMLTPDMSINISQLL